MGLIKTVKRLLQMLFNQKIKEDFDVKGIISSEMIAFVNECENIYRGIPSWIVGTDIDTINFAKTVCSETARLATLAIGVTIDGSARATYLQSQIDAIYYKLREWTEYGCAYGTIILKPNGKDVSLYLPNSYMITSESNGKVDGCVFIDQKEENDKYYTRFEYHRFEDELYLIDNICYVGNSKNDVTRRVEIENTPWNGLQESVAIENLEKPLFGVLKMPNANNRDVDSPMGMPIYAEALQEMKDLDIAYSRNAKEIFDSKRTVLLDADRLLPSNSAVSDSTIRKNKDMREKMGLPEYVAIVDGSDNANDMYQEINPTLNTEERLKGLNALLSQLGFKCGFSNGYFVFNEKTGMVTATQVESDDRRTIQLIKDIRDRLENCLDDLIYALDKMASLYGLAPLGTYEVVYDFQDLTQNFEEDRLRWWGYVQAGKIPAWLFFVKFEGMSEEEARAMVEEATPKEESDLFGKE